MALSIELQSGTKPAGDEASRLFRAFCRWAAVVAVFLFSAATLVAVAFAAPLALGVSAAVRAVAPARRRGRWRLAQPA